MTNPSHERPPAVRVARNTALRALAEMVGKLASLALFVVMARVFEPSTLGEYVFALAIVQLLWPVSGLGLDRLLLRDVARDRTAVDRLFYDALVLKVGAALAVAGLAAGVVALLGYSGQVQVLVLLLGVLHALSLATTSAQTIFQTYEQMDYYVYATVPRTIVSALAGLAVIALGGGIVAVCVAFVVVGALGTAFAFAIMFRWFVRPRREVRVDRLPGLAWRAAPLGVQEALGQVTFRIDIVLLSLLTTSAVVGAYGAGYRILEATLFLAWSVATSVLPMYSYLDRSSQPSLDRVFGASIKFALVIVVPIAVTLFVCSRAVVDLLFGLDEYGETVGALRWLALAIAVYPVGHLASALVAVRRPGRLTIFAAALVASANIVLNLLLIPVYGILGAAATTLASEVLLAVVSVMLARPEARAPWRWVLFAPVAAGLAMGGAMAPLADDLHLAVPVGAVVYLAALALVEGPHLRHDLAVLRRAARARAPLVEELEPQAP